MYAGAGCIGYSGTSPTYWLSEMINARSEEHYGGYDLNYGGNCFVNSSYRDVDGAYGMFYGCDRLADAWAEVVDRDSVTVDGWSVMVKGSC